MPARIAGQLVGDPHAAALQADEDDAVGAVVALDDLVGDAGERPAHVVGAQDLSRPCWPRSLLEALTSFHVSASRDRFHVRDADVTGSPYRSPLRAD